MSVVDDIVDEFDRPADDEGDVNVLGVLDSALAMLQVEPQRYKLFGIYWWVIKALLRRRGYTQKNLYMLGSYQDPDTAGMIPHLPLAETIREAVGEQSFNARYPHADGRVENPDGELVNIFDQDADF